MKTNILFLVLIFVSNNAYPQNNCYCGQLILNENDEIKYINRMYIDILLDSLKLENIKRENIKEERKIVFTDHIDLYGLNRANFFEDVILNSGNFFYYKDGERIIIDYLLDFYSESNIQKKCIYLDSLLVRLNIDFKFKSLQLQDRLIKFGFRNEIEKIKGKGIRPLIISLSYNLEASIVRLKFSYLDFNFYCIKREPLMLDSLSYVEYNRCIQKKFGLSEKFEKNYIFKKVKYILLIEIKELEILDETGKFVKIIP